ncbi:MAG: hypothetical protein JRH19_18370 [Deltaproteobacteria bacterium]|nr:hypothetical protein [Deltaproteobacteria bacterium]
MRRATIWNAGSAALCAALWSLTLAPIAGAQKLTAVDPGPEIVRDTAALSHDLRPRPIDDPDVADTALIFTNKGSDARVFCVGFDKEGDPVGRAWLKLPRLGLRYMLASDLSHDRDFVGHVQCSAPGQVKGSSVFLGPGLTDLPVIQTKRGVGRMTFLLVATY